MHDGGRATSSLESTRVISDWGSIHNDHLCAGYTWIWWLWWENRGTVRWTS